jgi:hypothetical protein
VAQGADPEFKPQYCKNNNNNNNKWDYVKLGQMPRFTPAILAIGRWSSGGSWFKASQGKTLAKPYLNQ